MQSVSSRIWTRVAVSISCDDNHYTTGTWRILCTLFSTADSGLCMNHLVGGSDVHLSQFLLGRPPPQVMPNLRLLLCLFAGFVLYGICLFISIATKSTINNIIDIIISTLEGTLLKLVDKFPYLGSSVESTEKDIETRLTKAWTAINRLSIIWKSDLTDKMKRSFFQPAVTSILLYGCTTWTNKTAGEEARRQLHKNAACNLEQVLAATPHKTPTVRPPTSYHENYSS